MSIEEKIESAKSSTWVTDGIPKWQVWLIVHYAKIKARIYLKAK